MPPTRHRSCLKCEMMRKATAPASPKTKTPPRMERRFRNVSEEGISMTTSTCDLADLATTYSPAS